jgi:outer membrane protein
MRKTTLALAISAALGLATQAQAADLWDTYQLALKNDPTFQQAEANYEAAVEAQPIARSGYLPNVSFNASRSRNDSNGTFFTETGTTATGAPIFGIANSSSIGYTTNETLQLTQPIFNWAAWNNMDQADATAAQAAAQFTAAQEDLIVRTATAYFNVLNARDTLAADHAATESNSKQLEQAKEKYDVGMSAITDVENAQAAYDQSSATEIAAQQAVTTAEENLRAITGQAVGDLVEPSPDMALRSPEPGNAQQWVDQALKQNPNVLAAQAAADAASANVSIKEAGHYPTLNAIAQRNKVNQSASNNPFSTSNTNATFLELQLSVPIFEGGGTQAAVNQAQRQYDAAEDQVKLVTRQTEQQARTNFLGVLTGISQVTALKQSVKSNQVSLDATETGMQVGTRTIVDVLTARQNLLTAQTGFANARYTYLEDVLQLKSAAGILSEADIKQMNAMLQVAVPPANGSVAPTAAPAMGTGMPPAATPPATTNTQPAAANPPLRKH